MSQGFLNETIKKTYKISNRQIRRLEILPFFHWTIKNKQILIMDLEGNLKNYRIGTKKYTKETCFIQCFKDNNEKCFIFANRMYKLYLNDIFTVFQRREKIMKLNHEQIEDLRTKLYENPDVDIEHDKSIQKMNEGQVKIHDDLLSVF